MPIKVSITLHGPEEEAGTLIRCNVDALTVNKIRAAFPVAGKFLFRLKRRFEGDDVWWDLLGDPDALIAVDDQRAIELRALCIDPDDPTWDGPVVSARSRPSTETAREWIGTTASAAKEKAAELRDKVKTNETVQRAKEKAAEMREKLNSQRRNVTGKLSQWLDR